MQATIVGELVEEEFELYEGSIIEVGPSIVKILHDNIEKHVSRDRVLVNLIDFAASVSHFIYILITYFENNSFPDVIMDSTLQAV